MFIPMCLTLFIVIVLLKYVYCLNDLSLSFYRLFSTVQWKQTLLLHFSLANV